MDNLTRHLVAVFALAFGTPNFALGSPQVIMTGHHRMVSTSFPTCVQPSASSQWFAYNAGSTCLPGGVTCTNSANMNTVPDAIDGMPLATNSGTNKQPVYTTLAINSLPSWAFDGSGTDQQVLFLGAGDIVGNTTFAMYAVINVTATSGTYPIFASSAPTSGGRDLAPIWYINPSGQQNLAADGIANIVTGSTNVSGSWKAIAFTYNSSTLVGTTYNIAGGTATMDTTNTATTGMGNLSNQIGGATFDALWFNGQIAEVGYINSASLTGVATYVQCRYGI